MEAFLREVVRVLRPAGLSGGCAEKRQQLGGRDRVKPV